MRSLAFRTSAIFRRRRTRGHASPVVLSTVRNWRVGTWMNGCAVRCMTTAAFTRSTSRFCGNLQPHVILTQKLCDVCAVGYGTVAKLAQTLPGPPRVVNLEPTSLTDIFDDIRRVAETCDVRERAEKLIVNLSERAEKCARTRRDYFGSPTLFCDGVGGSAVLFRPLGTGGGRDRRWPRFVRPQTSAVGASRLAASVGCASRDYLRCLRFADTTLIERAAITNCSGDFLVLVRFPLRIAARCMS